MNSDNENSGDNERNSMRTVQSDLEHVEEQLGNPTGNGRGERASGRAFADSISSALGSIRSRLEDIQGASSRNEAETNTALARANSETNSVLVRLWERLRHAELANSAHIPLDMLRSELSGREACHSSSSSTAKRKNEGEETESSDSSDKRPRNSSRTPSTLLASRRKAEELEGPQVDMDLHGTLSVLQSSTRDFGEDNIEVVLRKRECKSDHGIGEEVPSILLTRRHHSSLDLAQRSVLFPERTTKKVFYSEAATAKDTNVARSSATIVYSWGSGVNSLHDDCRDVSKDKARLDPDSRVGRTDILSCSVGKYHSACTTADGQVLITGLNTAGQVDPDRRHEEKVNRPILLESLYQARIVQVSCGVDHTAAVLSNGAVLTWGSNIHGQLGHNMYARNASTTFCRPATMVLGPGRHATAVACGDGFTLCLTSRMSLLACGVADITGHRNEESRRLPSLIPALEDLPLVAVAAGRRHAVAVTSHGTAFAWGINTLGCCGLEYPECISIPVPIKIPHGEPPPATTFLPQPLSSWAYRYNDPDKKNVVSLTGDIAVVHAACGEEHTVLVTRSGRLLVCGSNRYGQLGLRTDSADTVYNPEPIEHPYAARGGAFVHAEAGECHTLLLDSVGDVWEMGGKDATPGCTLALDGLGVRSIAAGGKHSVAVAVNPNRSPPMREFSERDEELMLADCVEDLIHTLSEEEAEVDVRTKIATRIEELFRTPAVLNSLFLDPVELEDFFSKLLNVRPINFQQAVASAIEKGIRRGLDTLSADDARLMWPEQVRFLLLYIQCPLFVNWKREDVVFDRRGDLILSLCNVILDLSYEGYRALMGWATSIYPRELFVRLLIQPLLRQLQKALSVSAGAERRPIPAVVQVLRWLYNAAERAGTDVDPADFYSEAVGNMNPEMLLDDMMRFKKATKDQRAAQFFFCDNPFLFSPSTKRNLLQIENEMNMLRTAAATGLTYNVRERTFEFDPFYVLDVDREHLLTQTLQKIEKAKSSDLRKKLRVVFKGEDGVDAGGVTREYFQLLCAELFDVTTGMWSTRFQDGNITWFNADCYWNDEGYYLSGVLVGLAVYNSVLLDVNFPQAVYRKLLGQPLGLEDMVDDSIRSGLQKLLEYEGDDVEEVFGLTFDVNWVGGFGDQKRKELKTNGSNIPVTSDNKEEYVMLYVRWLLSDSIYPQYENFEAGFMRVMEDTSLDILRPEELELLVVGTPELDFAALEKKTEYEGGYSAESEVVQNFWKFIKSAPRETQLNFLKFATGSTRAPIGGLGEMYFKIQRAGPDSMHLPSAHTCFNTLLLPDYGGNYEKLKERLGRAIVECEGFGLQ